MLRRMGGKPAVQSPRDLVLAGLLEQFIGPKGRRFLPIVGALGAFILVGNYLGLVPGFMAPTSNINVTVGCALTAWVYYHLQGIMAQGLYAYIKHFVIPPGVPVPLAIIISRLSVSHFSRLFVVAAACRTSSARSGHPDSRDGHSSSCIPLSARIIRATAGVHFRSAHTIYLRAVMIEHHDEQKPT